MHLASLKEYHTPLAESTSQQVATTEEIRITTPPEISGMGHRMKRKEDPRFIRGQGNYVDDVKLPGMLHMALVRSPYAHAKITKIDASAALAIPGVLAVITGQDLKAAGNLHWMPTLMSDTQMVLPIDKVVYYNQEVCAVVATDRYIAADGVEAVLVELHKQQAQSLVLHEPAEVVVRDFEARAGGGEAVGERAEVGSVCAKALLSTTALFENLE